MLIHVLSGIKPTLSVTLATPSLSLASLIHWEPSRRCRLLLRLLPTTTLTPTLPTFYSFTTHYTLKSWINICCALPKCEVTKSLSTMSHCCTSHLTHAHLTPTPSYPHRPTTHYTSHSIYVGPLHILKRESPQIKRSKANSTVSMCT